MQYVRTYTHTNISMYSIFVVIQFLSCEIAYEYDFFKYFHRLYSLSLS